MKINLKKLILFFSFICFLFIFFPATGEAAECREVGQKHPSAGETNKCGDGFVASITCKDANENVIRSGASVKALSKITCTITESATGVIPMSTPVQGIRSDLYGFYDVFGTSLCSNGSNREGVGRSANQSNTYTKTWTVENINGSRKISANSYRVAYCYPNTSAYIDCAWRNCGTIPDFLINVYGATTNTPVEENPPFEGPVQNPVTVTIKSDRDKVNSGEKVNLSWETKNAKSCTSNWSEVIGTNQTVLSRPSPEIKEQKTFKINCKNSLNQDISAETTVTINDPTLNFTVEEDSVDYNTSTTLSYKTTNAASCKRSDGWTGSGISATNVTTGNLTTSKTYKVECTGINGNKVEDTKTVSINAPESTLTVVDSSVEYGKATTLKYTSKNATSCKLSGGTYNNLILSSIAIGSITTGNLKVGTTFKLNCSGPGGDAGEKEVTISINAPEVSLSAKDNKINYDYKDTVTLTYSVKNATSCTRTGNDSWKGSLNPSATTGSFVNLSTNVGSIKEQTTFTLTCDGPGGRDVKQEVTLYSNAPEVTLTTDAEKVDFNKATYLRYTVKNAKSCYFTKNGSNDGYLTLSNGSHTSPNSKYTGDLKAEYKFVLVCLDSKDNKEQKDVIIGINPPVVTLEATKQNLNYGEKTNLKYTAKNATSCTKSGDWSGSLPPNASSGALSSSWDTGSLTESKTYRLNCSGPGGSDVEKEVVVSVAEPGAPTLNFIVENDSVDYNTSTKLTYTTTNVTSCRRLGDWSGSYTSASGFPTGNLFTSKTYKVECIGINGAKVEDSKTVSIKPPEVTLTVGHGFVDYNTATTIRYTAKNATSCTRSGTGWSGTLAPGTLGTLDSSQSTGSLRESKTFTLSCEGPGGSDSKSVTVNVGACVDTTWTPDPATRCTTETFTQTGTECGSTRTGISGTKDCSLPLDSPTLNFTVDKELVDYNTPATLTYTTTNVISCRRLGDWSGDWSSSYTSLSSFSTGNLTTSKTYKVECIGINGAKVEDSKTVSIKPPEVTLTVGHGFVDYNTATTIRYTAKNATSCTRSGTGWSGTLAPGTLGTLDSSQSTGSLRESKTFTLSCEGPGGSDSKSVTVNVGDCVDTTWTPDPATKCTTETFTQTSNCEKTKLMTGTKDCSLPFVDFVDIGFRVKHDDKEIKIAFDPKGVLTSPLRMTKKEGNNVVMYGVSLIKANSETTSSLDYKELKQLIRSNGTDVETWGIDIYDFNNDSIPDFVTANKKASSISVFLSNQNGTENIDGFKYNVSEFSVGWRLRKVKIGDLDGDGKADIVAVGDDRNVSVVMNKGDNTFKQPIYFGTDSPYFQYLDIIDINGDGKIDIVAGTPGITVLKNGGLKNDGNPNFDEQFSTNSVAQAYLTAGKINNDTFGDVVASDFNTSTIAIMLGNEDGELEKKNTYYTLPYPGKPIIADFNNDGISDLAVASYSAGLSNGVYYDYQSPVFSIFLGKNNGEFEERKDYGTRYIDDLVLDILGSATIDYNNDGKKDIVLLCNRGYLIIYLNKGDGTFESLPKIHRYTPGMEKSDTLISFSMRNDGKINDLLFSKGDAIGFFLVKQQSGSNSSLSFLRPEGASKVLIKIKDEHFWLREYK